MKLVMNIKEMRDAILATNAFSGVSFEPGKRIKQFADDFESNVRVIEEKCKQYEVVPERLVEKCFRLAMDYLHAERRCLSWAITGPARFPVARNEKRLNSAMNKLNKYIDFYENIEKTLKRKNESEDDKKIKWVAKLEQLKSRQEMMNDILLVYLSGGFYALVFLFVMYIRDRRRHLYWEKKDFWAIWCYIKEIKND